MWVNPALLLSLTNCDYNYLSIIPSRGGATIGSGWYISPPLSKAVGYKGVQVGSTGGYRLLLFVA